MEQKKALKVFFIVLCTTLLASACANKSQIISEQADLQNKEGTGIIIAGLSVLSPDRRLNEISGWCKNLSTGENIKCLRQGRGFSGKPHKIGRFNLLKVANAYRLPIGQYELHTLRFETIIGTQYSNGSSSSIVDKYNLQLGDKAVKFEVQNTQAYLGHFNFMVHYDYLYQPVITNLVVRDALSKDILSLPESLRVPVLNKMQSKQPLVKKTALKFNGFTQQGNWGQLTDYQQSKICFDLDPWKKGKVKPNHLMIQTAHNGFPSFPSKEFSKMMVCALNSYMQRNNHGEFRQTSKFSTEKVNGLLGAGKLKQYKFPVEFR